MPDSLFRSMLRRNVTVLLVVLFISISVSIILKYHILENKYKTITYVNLQLDNKTVNPNTVMHQQFIRILKNTETREVVIKKFNLIDAYQLNQGYKYYSIQLNKSLYDNLKVEEQSDGRILLSFVDKDIQQSKSILIELLNTGLKALKKDQNLGLKINYVSKGHKFQILHIYPKLFSVLLLITLPVLLTSMVFIAVKEKMFLKLDIHDK